MFILEEPYVSDLMIKTLKENNFEVFKNDFAKDFDLNFTDVITNKVYSNSENSIDLVLKDQNSSLSKIIEICKDKSLFREKLSDIYPNFFYKNVPFDELETISNLPFPVIIKPSVGFLSLGVHKVKTSDEWKNTVKLLKEEVKTFKKLFPEKVLNSNNFIIEEVIEGNEYAIDAYYDKNGKPVIIDIFKHPFASDGDVSDRIYLTSKKIIMDNFKDFQNLLVVLGEKLNLKNFPLHIEVRKNDKEVIPIEINPMRFAGWCTTDTAYYAYGINVYEYFENDLVPNWDEILKNKGDETYYFAMAETPADIDKNNIKFDYDAFKLNFSNILEFREIDYKKKPLFAILFGYVTDNMEIEKILKLNTSDYIK